MNEEKDAKRTSVWSKFLWEGGRASYYLSLLVLLASLIIATIAFSQMKWLLFGFAGLVFIATLVYRFVR
jgi:hypothetical protein